MIDDQLQIELEEEEEVDEQDAEFLYARQELQERCTPSGIKLYELDTVFGSASLCIELSSGREKRVVRLFNTKQIKKLLELPFEDYIFLGDYIAICSYKNGIIEAELRSAKPLSGTPLYRRLSGQNAYGEKIKVDDFLIEARQQYGFRDVRISIKQASETLSVLSSLRNRPFRPSILIEGLEVSQHDVALSLLERISNSVCFQIDSAIDLPLVLVKDRKVPLRRSLRRDPFNLEFPVTEFDEAPMALYWYARSATGMPLLQFLAFYQSIEFYFPIHSQAEAQRKVRNVLKDPTFRLDRDTDIRRILSSVKSIGTYGFGDERSQMKATLQECLDPDDLRAFLVSGEDRQKFFSSKTKGLTGVGLPINNPAADLRNDVAERIYDLRCKIVHTKAGGSDGEVDLLLPFSKEAELLYFDIELIQYLARKVLIAGSSPLSL